MFAADETRWDLFIPAVEAAGLLGVHIDSLTRRCRAELAGRGLAMHAAPPGGGQPKWYIRRDFDARLAPKPIGQLYQEPDLSIFTEKQQHIALQRRACVERFARAMASQSGKVQDWLPGLVQQLRDEFPELGLSRSQLYRWHGLYRHPADTVKLIDRRGRPQGGLGDPAAWRVFEDLFLHENRPSLKQCWQATRAIAEQNGWEWCGLQSCYAQLDRRICPDKQLQHRDPVLYRQRLLPTIEQDPEAWPARVCWIGDHHQLNIWCRSGKKLIRPWLTAWMDWRTRRICGWVLVESPDSRTILAALDHGLGDEKNCGGPDVLWIDNGRDYDAYVFHGQSKSERRRKMKPAVDEGVARGIFNLLKIEAHFSQRYNPNGKARLERWFGTLEPFYRTFETYTGNSPETKPERLKYVLSRPGLIPSFRDVYERLRSHIEGYNNSADHGIEDLAENGERLSPNEAMWRWHPSVRVPADPNARRHLLQFWSRPLTVGKNGISVKLLGRVYRYGQFAPELRQFKGLHKDQRRPVLVAYDPHDIQRIRVYTERLEFVCEVEMNRLGGMHGSDPISLDHVAELNRQKSAYAKATRHKAELAITSVLTNEENLSAIAAGKSEPEPVEPAPMKIVATALDGQDKAIRRHELKRAVGDGTREPGVVSALDRLTARRLSEQSHQRRDEDAEWVADPWAKLRGAP